MTGWAPKRFWSDATVTEAGGGFQVLLDGRAVRTPAKAPLVLPTRAMAEAVAAEWRAQEREVDPRTMPVTRAANSAIDRVARHRAEVIGIVAAYGDSDLLCYRAEGPAALCARQCQAWDPLLARAARELGAPLATGGGVIHVAQPAASLSRLAEEVAALDDFALTAFHDLVALSGSLVIGFAAIRGWDAPDRLWQASRVDELWQEALWGRDEDAAEMAERKRRDFLAALSFHRLARGLPAGVADVG